MPIKALYPWRFVIFLGVLGFLLWGIFRPSPPPQYFSHMDKVLHLVAFFVTALTARYATSVRFAWLTWILLLLLAPSLEYLQHELQPTRTFNYWDLLANLSGIILAWLIWPVVAYFAIPQHNPSDDFTVQ